MYCKKCQHQIEANTNVCSVCSTKLDNYKVSIMDMVMIGILLISIGIAFFPVSMQLIYVAIGLAGLVLMMGIINYIMNKNQLSVMVIILSITSIILQSSWYLFYELLFK